MDSMIDQPNSLNYVLDSFRDNTIQTPFFKEFPHLKVTNGVRYAAEHYSLQWMISVIFCSQDLYLFDSFPFQIWHFQRISDSKVMIVASNVFGRVVFTEKIDDGLFRHDYFKLFMVEKLLLLPSETKGS